MSFCKVAIVTGGARGLGKSFCKALLQRSYKVYFCDINTDGGTATHTSLSTKFGGDNVKFFKCDVRDENQFKALFQDVLDQHSRLDVLINNAGIIHETDWRRCVDINLKGTIQGSLLAMDAMKKSNGGTGGIIINVSSLAGIFPAFYSPVYSATKSAVIQFTRSWSANPHLLKNGIRLVSLCPAFVDTNMINPSENQLQGKEFLASVIEQFGVMPEERMMEALSKVLTDDDNNGKSLLITKDKMQYYPLPSFVQNKTE